MKHSYKKMSAVFLSIVMLLALAACSVPGYPADLSSQVLSGNIANPDALPADDPTTPSTTPTEPIAEPIPEKTKDPVFISVEEAKALILQHLGVDSGSFREIDTDLDDREYELEVTVNDVIYDFEMDAVTGKILKKETEHIVKKTESTPKETASKETTSKESASKESASKETTSKKSAPQLIGMDKAKQIVREHLADANAVFTDAELDDGRYELEVYSGNMEYDYEIHATSGKIMRVEREYRDHDDDDCRHNCRDH